VIGQGALAAAFDDVILFTATRYWRIQIMPFGHFVGYGDQIRPLKYLFPLVALLTLITCIRDWRRSLHDPLFRACVAFGLAGFIACFPRPTLPVIGFVAPLVCPLLIYCMDRLVASWHPKYRYALAALVIVLSIPSVRAFSSFARTALHGELVATPRGHAKFPFFHDGARELMARIAAAQALDPYFFYPGLAMLPFLTAREQVSKYDVFVPGYTSPSQYQEACISVVRRARWLVIDWNSTDPTFLKKTFPAMRDAEPREKKGFELALQRGFEFIARDGPFELRRRVKTVNETVCEGIAD
jgi:hypothetical protein